jgi:hypothetical protein
MASENEARRLLSAVTGYLTALPNVVGVGVVPTEGSDSEATVAVYVRSKVPKEALKPEERVPETVTGLVDGVSLQAPTRVIEVGDFKF